MCLVMLTIDFFASREEFAEEKSPGANTQWLASFCWRVQHIRRIHDTSRDQPNSGESNPRPQTQASRVGLAPGLFVRHVRGRNEPCKRGVFMSNKRQSVFAEKRVLPVFFVCFVLLTFDFFVCREDFSSGSKSPADPRRRIPIGHK